jgi:hypothetical protein
MIFETKMREFSSYKLSEQDWTILEGLETVLHVSYSTLLDPWTATAHSCHA